jgi:hypothetical protein
MTANSPQDIIEQPTQTNRPTLKQTWGFWVNQKTKIMDVKENCENIANEKIIVSEILLNVFNQWCVKNLPDVDARFGKLKFLIGNMWVNFHDAPEPMQRGVFEDFKKSVLSEESKVEQ